MADPPLVWYTMREKAVQWNMEHLEKKGKREKLETSQLQYLQVDDMIAVVSDKDCRVSEFRLFNIAFNWTECQRQVLLKQLLKHIDLQLMDAPERDLSYLTSKHLAGLTFQAALELNLHYKTLMKLTCGRWRNFLKGISPQKESVLLHFQKIQLLISVNSDWNVLDLY